MMGTGWKVAQHGVNAVNVREAHAQVLRFLGQQPAFSGTVHDIKTGLGINPAYSSLYDPPIEEAIWDLIIERVLTIESKGNFGWDYLRMTDFGAEVVKEQRWSPYDPDGYLKELVALAPKASRLCGIYVQEALRCFNGGSYLATAVMLGAASEGVVSNLFHRLVEAMKTNGQMPEFEAYARRLSRAHSVFDKYGEFKKHFEPVRSRLPGQLNDDRNLQLDGVFNLIRYYRNSAGHPTGANVERMTAFTSLRLFVPYCERIENLGDWLEQHASELHG
jgi:hypothetical protein